MAFTPNSVARNLRGTPAPSPGMNTTGFSGFGPPEPSPVSQPLRTPDEEISDYLAQLDSLRQQSERNGDFVKAQQCVNKMRDVNLRYAKKIEATAHQSNLDAKERIAGEHQLEIATFSRMWEDKLQEYDANVEVVVAEMKGRHIEDYAKQEGMLKVQLMNRRPRFSKAVMDLRDSLERMIQQRKYLEAEDVKQRLAGQERFELESFDDSLATIFEKKTQTMKSQYINEKRAVEQKAHMGREELLSQRRIDFERLLKRHNNVLKDMDQETKLHVSKTRQYVLRQVKALVHDPVKTGLDLRGVSKTLRDGQGKKFGYGGGANRSGIPGAAAARARTPPATSRNRSVQITSTTVADDDSRYGW